MHFNFVSNANANTNFFTGYKKIKTYIFKKEIQFKFKKHTFSESLLILHNILGLNL